MLAYLAILGASLAGYAGVKSWVVAAAAVALSSISYAQHQRLFERGRERGLIGLLDIVLLRSLGNAFIAGGIAYGFGWLLRLF